MSRVIVTIVLFVASHSTIASAQASASYRVGIGAAFSVITGTPEREPPKVGEHMTGAFGPSVGSRFSLLLDKRIGEGGVRVGAEGFRNELSTEGLALNCVHDEEVPNLPPGSKICYLAATSDVATGILFGPSLSWRRGSFSPVVALRAGAARYDLDRSAEDTPNNQNYSVSHVRPVYKATAGVEVEVGRFDLGFEAGLEQGLGRGSGTTHIPVGIHILRRF